MHGGDTCVSKIQKLHPFCTVDNIATSQSALQKMSRNSITISISFLPISQPIQSHSLLPTISFLFTLHHGKKGKKTLKTYNILLSIHPMYTKLFIVLYPCKNARTHASMCHSPLFFPRRGHLHKNRSPQIIKNPDPPLFCSLHCFRHCRTDPLAMEAEKTLCPS